MNAIIHNSIQILIVLDDAAAGGGRDHQRSKPGLPAG